MVYHYRCQYTGCPATYVGMTTMRLSKRLSVYLQEGVIFQHHERQHKMKPSRMDIISNTKIFTSTIGVWRLRFLETIVILNMNPSLNIMNEVNLLPSLLQRIRISNNNIQNSLSNYRSETPVPSKTQTRVRERANQNAARLLILTRNHSRNAEF